MRGKNKFEITTTSTLIQEMGCSHRGHAGCLAKIPEAKLKIAGEGLTNIAESKIVELKIENCVVLRQ